MGGEVGKIMRDMEARDTSHHMRYQMTFCVRSGQDADINCTKKRSLVTQRVGVRFTVSLKPDCHRER